jgi:hypothetical protein
MFAVGATAVLGGSLGALAGAGTRHTLRSMDAAAEDLRINAENGGLEELGGSVGAARATGTLEEEATGRLGPTISPLTRLLSSGSRTAKGLANRLMRHNFYSGKNKDGAESAIPVEVETTRMQQGMTAKYLRATRENYKAMLGAKTFTGARMGRGMKYHEFLDEVGKAMRRNDTSENEWIAKTAADIRTNVITPVTKGFQELGDLPEELTAKYADSYLPRVYDAQAISKNMDAWLEKLTVHFTGKETGALEARQLAQDVTDKILGSPTGRMPLDIVGESGHLKERMLNIRDDDLEDFLVSNVDDVMQHYLRSTVPELNLKRAFGDHELDAEMQLIRDEYTILVDKAKTNKERDKLRKQMERDINDTAAIRDMMLGRFLPPRTEGKRLANMARTARGLSFMANLGMMTVSAIPDIARPIMQNGAKAWAKALPRALLYHAKNTKVARQSLEEMGIGVDNLLNTRLYAMAELDEVGTRMNRWTQRFAKFSGMNHWNSAMKKVAAFTAQNRFIDDAINYSGLTARRKERLAKAGINERMAGRIAKDAQEHGEKMGGSWNANTEKWTDREAAGLFERVLLKDVDNTIVTPGVGDRPLLMQYETGKALMQFKSFFLAAHNQVFIPLAQQMARGDVAAMNGIMTGIALGMMGEYIRLNLSGRADEMEAYSMQDWARAGLDRSGLATVPMEVFNLADRMAWGKLSQPLGLTEGSRYFYRNWLGSLLGPTVGYATDIGELAMNMTHGDGITASDIHSLRRLLPYQNMFYLRHGINKIEENIARSAGVTPRKRRRNSDTIRIQ